MRYAGLQISLAFAVLGLMILNQERAQQAPGSGSAPSSSAQAVNLDEMKQRETLRRMKVIAVALEQFKVDNNYYPAASSFSSLAATLEPDYFETGKLREYSVDGWGRPMRYETWADEPDPFKADHYVIVSGGRDGVYEQGNIRQYQPKVVTSPDADLAISDGIFIRALAVK